MPPTPLAGRGDGTALRQILVQGLLLGLGLSLFLAAIALPFSRVALSVMQPSPELHDMTLAFFHNRLFGLPASLASYALVGWFLGAQAEQGAAPFGNHRGPR